MRFEDIQDLKNENTGIKKFYNQDKEIWPGIDLGPGPTTLIGGNMEAGFFGEVLSRDLIDGDELARRIGLTVGVAQFSNEPWLKFAYMGNVQYVAKKPLRSRISWTDLNNIKAVYGDKELRINGKLYKVRLLKGRNEGEQGLIGQFERYANYDSEWNKLMLPIHEFSPSSFEYRVNVRIPTEDWGVNYSNRDLWCGMSPGSYSWCQEKADTDSEIIARGGRGVADTAKAKEENRFTTNAWRPVLELVQE